MRAQSSDGPQPGAVLSRTPVPSTGSPGFLRGLLPVWKPLLLLYLITVLRSGLQLTTNNYLPFIMRGEGHSVTASGAVITVFLLLGGLGGIAGGLMAERSPPKEPTLYSGLFARPLILAPFF